jgi:hypothetical protein
VRVKSLKKKSVYIRLCFVDHKQNWIMGKVCVLCDPVKCENCKVHSSKEDEDITYCKVVWASRYEEDCKTDVKAGREVDDLEYGALEMEEGAAKEETKAEGVALAARAAEARETSFANGSCLVEERRVTHLTESRGKSVDTELRGILEEHEVEKEALRLEKVGILRKCELQRMWTEDETLFGEDGYSLDTLERLKEELKGHPNVETGRSTTPPLERGDETGAVGKRKSWGTP